MRGARTRLHRNRPYRCDICKRTFSSRMVADRHVEMEHWVSPSVASMLVTVRKRLRWTR